MRKHQAKPYLHDSVKKGGKGLDWVTINIAEGDEVMGHDSSLNQSRVGWRLPLAQHLDIIYLSAALASFLLPTADI